MQLLLVSLAYKFDAWRIFYLYKKIFKLMITREACVVLFCIYDSRSVRSV